MTAKKQLRKFLRPLLRFRFLSSKYIYACFSYLYEKYSKSGMQFRMHYEFFQDINITNTSIIQVIDFLKLNFKKSNYRVINKSIVIVANEHKKLIIKRFKNNPLSQIIISIDELDLLNPLDFDEIFWCTDNYDEECKFLRLAYKNKIIVKTIPIHIPTRSWNLSPKMKNTMLDEKISQEKDGFFNPGHGLGLDASYLLQLVDQQMKLEGEFVEIGCFNGSSGCLMLNYLKKFDFNKKFYFYDVFDGFNYQEALESGDIKWKNTHVTDGLKIVKDRLSKRYSNIEVIQRNICEIDSLKEVKSISFANIDVDIYEATLAALLKVDEKLTINGIIVCEDCGHVPSISGAFSAVSEFYYSNKDKYLLIHLESAQAILIKRK